MRKSRGMRSKEKAHHRACWKETLSAERREFAGVSPDRVDLSPESDGPLTQVRAALVEGASR